MGPCKSHSKREIYSTKSYLKKQEKSQINSLKLHLKELEKKKKRNLSRRKEIKKILADTF